MEQKIFTKSPIKFLIPFFAFFSFTFLFYTNLFAIPSAPVEEMPSIQDAEITNPPAEQIGHEMMTPTEPETSENENEFIEEEEEVLHIADPLYPWNKAMYHFNDRFYFWVLKPAAQGYSAVVPEDIRLGVSNFFYNLTTPIRFVSSLLQLKMKVAGNELIRFAYNSTVGVLGFADAAKAHLDISRHDEDLGQTIGSYGIGHGFYIVWPFIGPSSLRDTAGKIGDVFLNPVYYVNPTEAAVGIAAYDEVNETSFHIGDYEDFKRSAIDPYISMRDAYLQYRKKKVDE
ncbi:MAG: VacJ family lipoprotein [Nitrospirae bacterium]|nr:VacJ family lipoprotein [Nitrospirota bacterium]